MLTILTARTMLLTILTILTILTALTVLTGLTGLAELTVHTVQQTCRNHHIHHTALFTNAFSPHRTTIRTAGNVADPNHRDCGSLLTLSVLLSEPSAYAGAQFTYVHAASPEADKALGQTLAPCLGCGDGVLFVSEKRHNVTTLEAGKRHSFVIELWEGAPNVYNRHR
jgi:hypothetical protein